jgi:hypothetical protein
MLNQNLWQINSVITYRFLQIVFLFVALWSFFWAHIYEMSVWNKTFVESIQSSISNVVLYSMSIVAIITLEIYMKRPHKVSAVSPSSEKALEDLRKENELLKHELKSSKKTSSGRSISSSRVGVILLVAGALLLAASVASSSVILAFIGLGLTFWGVLFLFAGSTKFVKSTILDATVASQYTTLERIITDLDFTGKPMYIPPYPKKVYLPQHLAGLKDLVVFISAKDSATIPPLEEMAKKHFLLKSPEGMCFTPPGSELESLFERELSADFTKINQESLYENLQTVIVKNLDLASNVEIYSEKEQVYVKIADSVYSDLYSKEQNQKTIHSVGCPLTSAIACALAITTGKPVTITTSKFSPELNTIEVGYQIMEG